MPIRLCYYNSVNEFAEEGRKRIHRLRSIMGKHALTSIATDKMAEVEQILEKAHELIAELEPHKDLKCDSNLPKDIEDKLKYIDGQLEKASYSIGHVLQRSWETME